MGHDNLNRLLASHIFLTVYVGMFTGVSCHIPAVGWPGFRCLGCLFGYVVAVTNNSRGICLTTIIYFDGHYVRPVSVPSTANI